MNHSDNSNGPVFDVTDLCYSYNDEISALNHINLTIYPGEKLAILGSNGSGKSTLLKVLDGLYFPSNGTVKAFGQILSDQALRDDRFNFEFNSQVGFVFQDSDAQLFMPSVWDEMAFAPLQLGIDQSKVSTRVEAALFALDIEKLRNRPHPTNYPGEKRSG
jgi:cobalt/nickel transport system ATP-binding protein